jgi:lysophospholipase L1-like esterase
MTATRSGQKAPEAIRFAAQGDSLTAGLGDPVPGAPGGWRGWAALLAEGLVTSPGTARFVNRSRSGALTADVRRGIRRRRWRW